MDPALEQALWKRLNRRRKKAEQELNPTEEFASGAEARVDSVALAARLKSCPVTKPDCQEFFRIL
jgi:hypothetical protein